MTTQIFPAEFIFPGHPDKLCDAIADSLPLRLGNGSLAPWWVSRWPSIETTFM